MIRYASLGASDRGIFSASSESPRDGVAGARLKSTDWLDLCQDPNERVRRIELPYSAWEADVLPLNYTRGRLRL